MKRFLIFVFLLTTIPLLGNDLIEKGRNYYFSNNFEMAKISLERALRSTTNDEILLMLGNSYLATGEYKKAIQIFQLGSQRSSKSWVFEFNLGYSYYVIGDYSNSITYFLSARDKAPNFSKTYWFGGMASLRIIDIDTTINLWEKYLQLAPNGEESDNIRKALALLKEYGTNAIPEIIASSKDDIESLIGGIKNGFEIRKDQKTLEDTSLEDIER